MNMMHIPDQAAALCERIAQLINAGRTGAARPLLAAARKLSPNTSAIAMLAARLALRDGDTTLAEQELDSAIDAAPTHQGLRKYRADVRQIQGDLEGAARDAAEAVILDRNDPEAKAILGTMMLQLGHTNVAVACLREAVATAPAAIEYRAPLAAALETAGDADAALTVLTDGIGIGPATVTLRNAAILLCMRRRDFNQAVRLAEQARIVGIADACTFGMQGHAHASLGDHDAANLAYQEALKLGPEDPYVRHLVMAAGAIPGASRAAPEYVRAVFDGYAGRFEAHLASLSYATPVRIRAALLTHPKIAAGTPLGPVLDLGCGTGLVARAITDLAIGPITGVDLSCRMLDQARAKHLYAELRELDIVTELTGNMSQRWLLIIAADVLCYFGALEEVLAAVHASLEPGGWFLFSTEELLADHDGRVPGNGSWAMHRLGRYAHAAEYIHEAACAAGFRVILTDRHSIRREAGAEVPGTLMGVERLRYDA
jgi:predicted TPR repeat methyltransferase